MLHQGENKRKDKSIIWFIVVAVIIVLCLVIFAAVFLCITSWKGQVYSGQLTSKFILYLFMTLSHSISNSMPVIT